ncbi:MAG: NAD(P)-dependent oxidoreductase [Deltaproteobacteria bacterium]|nr:NAD(P)-dependent oxidoreductase [Deltaproteobacteria bacterium]
MSKPRIFIFAPVHRMGASANAYDPLEEAAEVIYGDASWQTPQGNSEEEMCSIAKNADALTGGSIKSSPITGKIMDSAPNLRIVAKCSIGVDDVDVEAATRRGILVTHGPTESNWSGVAEGAMAMMLTLLKKIRERDEFVKAGKWRDPSLQGCSLSRHQDGYAGITVGIIGLGRIGRRFADLLAPWRVRILAYDPYVEESFFILHNVERVDLATLLQESDVVSLHVVHTKETEQMLGAKEFALMKKGAVLVNTARGMCVNEKALVAALQSDHLAAAALDSFMEEPLPADSPLLKLGHKVLLSPHMASSNLDGGLRQGIIWANRAVLAAFKGEVPEGVYNKEVIPRWKERFGGRKL